MSAYTPFNDTVRHWRQSKRAQTDSRAGWVMFTDSRDHSRRLMQRVRHVNSLFLWDLGAENSDPAPVPVGPSQRWKLPGPVVECMRSWTAYMGSLMQLQETPIDTSTPFHRDLFAAVKKARTRPGKPAEWAHAHTTAVHNPYYYLAFPDAPCLQALLMRLDSRPRRVNANGEWEKVRADIESRANSQHMRAGGRAPTSSDAIEWLRQAIVSHCDGWPPNASYSRLAGWMAKQWVDGPPDVQALVLWAALQTMALHGQPGLAWSQMQHELARQMQRVVDTQWCWSSQAQTASEILRAEACERQLLGRLMAHAWDNHQYWGAMGCVLPVHTDRWLELAMLPNAMHPFHGTELGAKIWSSAWTAFCKMSGLRGLHDPLGRAHTNTDTAIVGLNPKRPSHQSVLAAAAAFYARPALKRAQQVTEAFWSVTSKLTVIVPVPPEAPAAAD